MKLGRKENDVIILAQFSNTREPFEDYRSVSSVY